MKPEPHIIDTLFNSEKVNIKGLGTFYSKKQPATIHPGDHEFQPPGCTIGFEYAPNTVDEGFIHDMAKKTNASEAEVEKAIDTFAEQTTRDLKAGKKVIMQNIGIVHYDSVGKVVFEADNSTNVSKEHWGLPAFKAEMVKREPREKTKVSTENARVHTQEKTPRRSKRPTEKKKKSKDLKKNTATAGKKKRTAIWLIIALLLVTSGAGGWYYRSTWLAWIPDSQHKSSLVALLPQEKAIEKKDPMPTGEEAPGIPSPPTPADPPGKEKPEHIDEPPGHLSEEPTDSKEEPRERPVKKPATPSQGDFLIIAGCFRSEKNAREKKEELLERGFPASIQGKTPHGLHRVVYGFYHDRQKALSELNRIQREIDSQAWLDRY